MTEQRAGVVLLRIAQSAGRSKGDTKMGAERRGERLRADDGRMTDGLSPYDDGGWVVLHHTSIDCLGLAGASAS